MLQVFDRFAEVSSRGLVFTHVTRDKKVEGFRKRFRRVVFFVLYFQAVRIMWMP